MQNGNVSPLRDFLRNKYIWIFWAIDAIAIIAVILAFIHQASKVSTIYFNVVPINATISVNGDTHYANGQYNIAPGQYKISISHEGLKTKTLSVNIEAHDYATVTIYLADDDNSFNFYKLKDNYESYKKLKTIASAENNITTDKDTSAQKFISDYERIISILKTLPLKGYVYTEPSANMSTGGFAIENGQNKKECRQSACLLVRYYGKDYENAVIEKIKEAGYNPSDYQIVYERYTS